MKLGVRVAMGLLGLAVSHAVLAQAPAGAPAGSNGMCKDGSYSTAASKEGACRGHKGVQTWFGPATAKADKSSTAAASPKAATPTAAASPKTAANAPAAAPVAKPSAQVAAPTPPATSAQSNSNMGKPTATKVSSTTGGASQKQTAPGGGNGQVWVNTASNVYHCEGTTYYGKTKAGAYMSESDAKAKGARPDAGKPCMK